MPVRRPGGSLTSEEKKIVKALLAKGWLNQDIQALINSGARAGTINSGRITSVKNDAQIAVASDDELELFLAKKRSFDPATGLNLYEHERLIRAREAMVLAVQVFNSPLFRFRTELFAVLSQIAWTYVLHEYYDRKEVAIVGADGRSLLLGQMLDRADCPLSDGVKRNLRAMKEIRDEVEHLLLRRSDFTWAPLFQACCLNFDNALRRFFGEQTSLQRELSFALQFSKLTVQQITEIQKFDLSEGVQALDARLRHGLTDDQLNDLEYQFRVIYTLDNTSKSKAHFQFIHPGSDQATEIQNVLLKYKPADELYPHKPKKVPELVSKQTGKRFSSHNHTQAWKLYKVRPKSGAKSPENTNRDFCIYHPAYRDYTYAEAWIDKLVGAANSDVEFAKIKATKV